MISKQQMERLLQQRWTIFPIMIPSYKRWDRRENTTMTRIIELCSEEVQQNTYLFVRHEQQAAYRDNFPTANIIALPETACTGLAATRQYLTDFCIHDLGKPSFIDMDDDITALKHVYYDNVEAKDRLSTKADANPEAVLRLGCAFSLYAFEEYGAVIGGLHRFRFASQYPASQMAFKLNGGSTPRHIVFTNGRALSMRGIKRSMLFDETGDDVGLVAEIAKTGGDFFQIQSLAYSYVDDDVNSVIRNRDNARQLASQEHQALLTYPIGREYLRISQKFSDGSYRFSDIDYAEYARVMGRPQATVGIEDFIAWAKRKKQC